MAKHRGEKTARFCADDRRMKRRLWMLITDIQRRTVSQREEKRERERERERESVKLPEHGEFKISVPAYLALRKLVIQFVDSRLKNSGNSSLYLRPEVSPSISSVFFHQEISVDRYTPPTNVRDPSFHWETFLSLVRCLMLISLTSFNFFLLSKNENIRSVSFSLPLFSSVIHRQWRFVIRSNERFVDSFNPLTF